MKGISLSIETVIILIIAVVILGILLYFLISGAVPGLEQVKTQQEASAVCARYAQTDSSCANNAKLTAFDSNDKTKLAGLCKKLQHSSCTGTLTLACVQQCCASVCPQQP